MSAESEPHDVTLERRRRTAYRPRLTHSDYFLVKHVYKFLCETLGRYVRNGDRVADIGCGEQPLRSRIENLGAKYVGVDLAQNCRGTVALLGHISRLPIKDSAFDVTLCTEVLEHVRSAAVAIHELSRITRSGGVVVLTSPFIYPLHEEPLDFARPTPHAIRKYAEENGLDVLTLVTSGNELEVIAMTWTNVFSKSAGRDTPFLLKRILYPMIYACTNILFSVVSSLFGPILPKKSFLSILCVLRKPESRSSRGEPHGQARGPSRKVDSATGPISPS